MSEVKTAKQIAIEKLKVIKEGFKMLFADDTPPATPPTPAAATDPAAVTTTDYTCQDGTVLTVDNLAVGGSVTISGLPAPDADYTLQDGTIITVLSGFITALTNAADPDDDSVDLANLQTPAQFRKAMQKFDDMAVAGTPLSTTDVAAMLKALMEYCFGYQLEQANQQATQLQAMNAYKANFVEAKKATIQMAEIIQTIAEEPIDKPIEKVNDTPMTAWQKRKAEKGE